LLSQWYESSPAIVVRRYLDDPGELFVVFTRERALEKLIGCNYTGTDRYDHLNFG
jgi:hypothetical protein